MRIAVLALLAACGGNTAIPTDTLTVCPTPDPMTLGYSDLSLPGCTGTPDQCNFGKTFMTRYCINCHDSKLDKLSERNGAPVFHDFNTLLGIIGPWQHIDEQTAIGPSAHNTFMPGAGTGGRCPSQLGGPLDEDCPQPTDDERETLGVWLICEHGRTHDLSDAGVEEP
jgi:hypothetical protein